MSLADTKPLPHNLDAERSVLGAILLGTEKAITAAEKLKPRDFFLDQNRRIFTHLLAMREAGTAIDLVTLVDRLQSKGELEAAGGAGYVASLLDATVPGATHIEQYARIVKEKAQLRETIHLCYAMQERALEGSASFEDICDQLELHIHASRNGHATGVQYAGIDLVDFLTQDIPPVSFVIDPIFPHQGLGMNYSWRGLGKTLFNLELGIAVATGGPRVFDWTIPERRRVVYVDGEMPANEMQERCRMLCLGRGIHKLERKWFEIITPDLEKFAPNIIEAKAQRALERHLEGNDFLILDNLSCLGHSMNATESEAESWWVIQDWELALRKKGISVWNVHHAGKNLEQSGTSARERVLHTVINLRQPSDWQPGHSFRCQVEFKKRRQYTKGSDHHFYPFELSLDTDARGGALWLKRPMKDLIEQHVTEMKQIGMTVGEIEKQLGIDRYRIYRILKKQPAASQ